MTFTYNGNLSNDLDTVRFRIRDTIENSGVLPNGNNFTDEEINGLLSVEGSVNRTVAALYEALAGAWSHYVDTQIGSRQEKLSQVAARYQTLAKEYRSQFGSNIPNVSTGFFTRVDGYSDDVSSGDV